jgi:hypothetical protein
LSSSKTSGLLPIRTNIDVNKVPLPQPAPEHVRQKLKENAKRFTEWREPYHVTIRASITERTIPVVTGSITLQGVDALPGDHSADLPRVEMMWDTGAHRTIISQELLPPFFQEYINDPIHDPYRLEGAGTKVQMDAMIVLSNCTMEMHAIVLVVPKSMVPNERVGILLGQKECIDRLVYESIPRSILPARGENLENDVWGDFILKEYLDESDNLVAIQSS